MRVALLLESDGPGGAETMMFHLAEGLLRRGHSVFPVGPETGEGWLGTLFREKLDLEPLHFRLQRAVDPACVMSLMGIFRDNAVDVVHAHEPMMASYATLAARLCGLPSIITLHSANGFLSRRRTRIVMRWAIRSADLATTISEATREEILGRLGVKDEEILTIPNGVPVPEGDGDPIRSNLGVTARTPLILAVGNLYQVKGHDVLIQALAILSRRRPDLPWVAAIAGRGGEHAALLARSAALGLSERVKFLGFRSDVGALLDAADVFVQPSRSEGMPLSVIEAMSVGLPVIASDVGGLREVLTSGSDGELVPPEDPGTLASLLERLLKEPLERARLGEAGRVAFAKNFDVNTMLEEYIGWYRSISGTARDRTLPEGPDPTVSDSFEPAQGHM